MLLFTWPFGNSKACESAAMEAIPYDLKTTANEFYRRRNHQRHWVMLHRHADLEIARSDAAGQDAADEP